MGHAALSTSAHLLAGGRFLPRPAGGPSSELFDIGLDLGFPGSGWCPDGLTEPVIDRRYGDLLHDHDRPDGPDGPGDGPGSAGLVVFFSPRVPAGQPCVAGGEAA